MVRSSTGLEGCNREESKRCRSLCCPRCRSGAPAEIRRGCSRLSEGTEAESQATRHATQSGSRRVQAGAFLSSRNRASRRSRRRSQQCSGENLAQNELLRSAKVRTCSAIPRTCQQSRSGQRRASSDAGAELSFGEE